MAKLDFTTYLTANPSPIPTTPSMKRLADCPTRWTRRHLAHAPRQKFTRRRPLPVAEVRDGTVAKVGRGMFWGGFSMTVSLVVISGIIAQLPRPRRLMDDPNELFTILCDDKKLLFIVADGIITGSGNDRSTPDLCLSIAVAAGHKQHNRAQVYAGHFNYKAHRVPTLWWSTAATSTRKPKAGNRGKRDSAADPHELLLAGGSITSVQHLMGVTPDNFETVLMVDADTKVYPDALKLLTYCLINDPLVRGLCGETKIANKRDSWVTGIQVFEVSESVFGGAPKGDRDWVPIITKPEIVQEYSQNVVETLHQKNLLPLGEDRFNHPNAAQLPNRKMMFVPQAVCKTVVPDEFSVPLSQRRRWINSTIHNLLELVLVRNLCGTFCFSMQFVIFMELIGTVVLPVAIIRRLINSLASSMPLVMLLAVLVSPAPLILITSRKLIMWRDGGVLGRFAGVELCPSGILLLALDDFSWGATRMVEGEAKGEAHGGKEGSFDASKVRPAYALLNDSSDNPYGNDYHSAHLDTTEFDLPQSNYQYHNNYRPPPKGFYN
ncbi:hypothetical protein L0F63_006717 [Massospora cicadina]|nr:hypothetical protein L0F63_006717 [Massospora cicadina]